MSDIPPPPPPPSPLPPPPPQFTDYAGYQPAKPARPTSVTVLAIIAIVIGGLGTACDLLGALAPLMHVPNMPQMSGGVAAMGVGIAVAKWVVAVVFLVGGIMSLMLKEAGRKAMISAAIADIPVGILAQIHSLVFMMPAQKALLARQPQPGFYYIGFAFGLLLVLAFFAYDICVIYFMKRPHVEAAFTASA